MNGWTPKDRLQPALEAISGIVTTQQISKLVNLTASGAKNLRVDVRVSSVTQVGTITVALQHATLGSDTYVSLAGANASATITADGIVSLTQNIEVSADQPNMPLRKCLQVVITTTNAGDAVTVDNVYVHQED